MSLCLRQGDILVLVLQQHEKRCIHRLNSKGAMRPIADLTLGYEAMI